MCPIYDDLEFDDECSHDKLMAKLVEKQENLINKIEQGGNKDDWEGVAMPKCHGNHLFHKDCLAAQLDNNIKNSNGHGEFLKCAVCEIIYGKRTGEMPDGEMSWQLNKNTHLQGYQGEGMISWHYDFPSGIKPDGTRYSGTGRSAFLPASMEGIEIFHMFVEAFRRRLSMMVGTSLTTGRSDTVVWAGIHHKTSMWGGQFGYPDPTYFSRVKEEFKVRGIDEETVKTMDKFNLSKGSIKIRGGKIFET